MNIEKEFKEVIINRIDITHFEYVRSTLIDFMDFLRDYVRESDKTDRLQIRRDYINEKDKPYRNETEYIINYTEDYVKWLEDKVVNNINYSHCCKKDSSEFVDMFINK